MSYLTLSKASNTVKSISGSFPPYGQKTVKAYQKVLCITTTTESANNSKELLKSVLDVKQNLLKETDNLGYEEIKEQSSKINKMLLEINEVLETIKNLFEEKDAKIEIDDENMTSFLSNFNDAKENLEYMSDFLTFANQAKKSKADIKEGKYVELTLEGLLAYINAA